MTQYDIHIHRKYLKYLQNLARAVNSGVPVVKNSLESKKPEQNEDNSVMIQGNVVVANGRSPNRNAPIAFTNSLPPDFRSISFEDQAVILKDTFAQEQSGRREIKEAVTAAANICWIKGETVNVVQTGTQSTKVFAVVMNGEGTIVPQTQYQIAEHNNTEIKTVLYEQNAVHLNTSPKPGFAIYSQALAMDAELGNTLVLIQIQDDADKVTSQQVAEVVQKAMQEKSNSSQKSANIAKALAQAADQKSSNETSCLVQMYSPFDENPAPPQYMFLGNNLATATSDHIPNTKSAGPLPLSSSQFNQTVDKSAAALKNKFLECKKIKDQYIKHLEESILSDINYDDPMLSSISVIMFIKSYLAQKQANNNLIEATRRSGSYAIAAKELDAIYEKTDVKGYRDGLVREWEANISPKMQRAYADYNQEELEQFITLYKHKKDADSMLNQFIQPQIRWQRKGDSVDYGVYSFIAMQLDLMYSTPAGRQLAIKMDKLNKMRALSECLESSASMSLGLSRFVGALTEETRNMLKAHNNAVGDGILDKLWAFIQSLFSSHGHQFVTDIDTVYSASAQSEAPATVAFDYTSRLRM